MDPRTLRSAVNANSNNCNIARQCALTSDPWTAASTIQARRFHPAILEARRASCSRRRIVVESLSSSYSGVLHPQVVVGVHTLSTAGPQLDPQDRSRGRKPGPGKTQTKDLLVHCPYCRHTDTRVLDSRVADDGASIRRRRQCSGCGSRFSTSEQMQLSVIKRSGVVEPFNREKVVGGVRKACKGRPVTEEQFDRLGQQVEDVLRASGQPEVPADEVGVAILGPLRELDQVAYLRFASVYRQFSSVDDFESEIAMLRDGEEPSGLEPLIPELDIEPARQQPARSGAGRRDQPTRRRPARSRSGGAVGSDHTVNGSG